MVTSDIIMDAVAGDGGPPQASEVRKKARKQRLLYSCHECRRLKMKCDRQVPCSNCVRRKRTQYCNTGKGGKALTKQDLPPRLEQSPSTGDDRQQQHRWLEHFQDDLPTPITSVNPAIHIDNDILHQSGSHLEQSPLNAYSQLPEAHTVDVSSSNRLEPTSSYQGGAIGTGMAYESAARSGNDGAAGDSSGTLLLTRGGRSKYLGPTAGSTWLKDAQMPYTTDTPIMSRAASPGLSRSSLPTQSNLLVLDVHSTAFPFHVSDTKTSTRDLLSALPIKVEAWDLAEAYFRYCSWHHDVCPKDRFRLIFNRIYTLVDGTSISSCVDPQEIALLFIVLAQGTVFNIEIPNHDPSVETWLHLSKQALVKGDFLSKNTVAGLQALHLMAHLYIHLDKEGGGDTAWSLFGLVMRLAQAMGMHRDGSFWRLSQDVIEERRKVFWECNTADILQAHCFSRPSTLNPRHYDTKFPSQPAESSGDKDYPILRYELSQHSSEILHIAMDVQKPSYPDVLSLDVKLGTFERNVPFHLRCRAALLSMPSRFPQVDVAIASSPEPSRRSMSLSFQQTSLALNISETFINLHRPYYAKALYGNLDENTKAAYTPSILTVIERCAIIINIVGDIHARFPTISARQWHFWFHVYGSALCLSTLLSRDPDNPMAAFAFTQIDVAIDLYVSMVQHGAGTPKHLKKLEWLRKLRARLALKISRSSDENADVLQHPNELRTERRSDEGEDSDDGGLLGWQTRLIERAGQGNLGIQTFSNSMGRSHAAWAGSSLEPRSDLNESRGPTLLSGVAEEFTPNQPLTFATPDSTDNFLQDFWNPMFLETLLSQSQDQHPIDLHPA